MLWFDTGDRTGREYPTGYKKPGIKGVQQYRTGWRGQLRVKGRVYHTKGVSATQHEAALAYNRLCEEHKLPGRCNSPEALSVLIDQ